MNTYSAQEVFINTESGFGTAGGDQINKWKVNLNQYPVSAEDDSQIKVSLTQFQMNKNFYDINKSNNAIRMFITGSADITSTDEMLLLEECDTTNANMLADLLRETISTRLTALFAEGLLSNTNTTNKSAWKVVSGDSTGIIKSESVNQINKNKFVLVFQAPTGKTFDVIPVFQCLQVNPTTNHTLTGATAPLSELEQFNDSYQLFGGKRIETFQQTPTIQSFECTRSETTVENDTLTITGFYQMSQVQDTLPYLYLRLDSARNQGSNNLLSTQEAHDHEISYTTTLAKIPRHLNHLQQVDYRLDKSNNEYFAILNTRYLNSMIFSITDHRGRNVQTIDGSSTDGNVFCNFSVKIEKIKVPFQPNRLNSGGLPIPNPRGNIPTLGFGPGNPN